MSDRDFSDMRDLGAGLDSGLRCRQCGAILDSQAKLEAHLREQHPNVREGDEPVSRPKGQDRRSQGG